MSQTQLRKQIVRASGGGKEAWNKAKLAHRIRKYLGSPSYVPIEAFFPTEELSVFGRLIRKEINRVAGGEVVKVRVRR